MITPIIDLSMLDLNLTKNTPITPA
jgi:hypothetical protein